MVKKNSFLKETETLRDLRALEAIEKNPNLSQRELAHSLDVAVGIANACIHTLVRKGMIKIRGDNNRSITYHLTKQGLIHKGILAMEWTKNTIDFYRQARHQVALELSCLAKEGIKTTVLYGAGELAEIAVIVASESGIAIAGVITTGSSEKDNFLGVPVGGIKILEEKNPDALAICVELDSKGRKKLERELEKIGSKIKVYDLTSREAFQESVKSGNRS